MPTHEQREVLDEILSGTLSRTIDFLKYAETKNAALLTFSSAWLVGIITLLTGDRVFERGPRAALATAVLLFALAALVALRSFLPKLDLSSLQRDPSRPKNLLYFGHIAEFEPTAYAARVRERYAMDSKVTISDDYLHDLAVQVSAISVITKRKFNTFYFGAALVALAIGVLTVTAMCMSYKLLWPQ